MTTPTINVNLSSCRCPVNSGHPQHWAEQCAAKPVPIPCHLPPSVTFKVALGRFPRVGPDHRTLPQERPSAARIAAYVERLIEQVGNL